MPENGRTAKRQPTGLFDLALHVLEGLPRLAVRRPAVAIALLLICGAVQIVGRSSSITSAVEEKSEGFYTGVILDEITKLPVSRLQITADTSEVRSTITDSQGRFRLVGPAGTSIILTIHQQSAVVGTIQARLQPAGSAVDYSYVSIRSAGPAPVLPKAPARRPVQAEAAVVPDLPKPVPLMAAAAVRVSGQVVDLQTGEPVPGATISVAGTSIETTTDSQGTFALTGLTAGVRLRLTIRHMHYASQERILLARAEELAPIPLRALP